MVLGSLLPALSGESTLHWTLCTDNWTLYTALCSKQCSLSDVHCSLCTVHFTFYSVYFVLAVSLMHYAVYTFQWMVQFSLQCALYNALCTLQYSLHFTVQWALYSTVCTLQYSVHCSGIPHLPLSNSSFIRGGNPKSGETQEDQKTKN